MENVNGNLYVVANELDCYSWFSFTYISKENSWLHSY